MCFLLANFGYDLLARPLKTSLAKLVNMVANFGQFCLELMNFVPKFKPFSIVHLSQDFSFDSDASRLFGGCKHIEFMACGAVVFASRSYRYRSTRSRSPHQLINIYESGIFAAFCFGVLYLFRRETGLLRVISCCCCCCWPPH